MSNKVTAPDPQAAVAFITNLANRQNGDLHDFKIKCGDREWKVHKLVLSTHSPVLHAACTKNFTEAAEGTIDLSEEDPDLVHALVFYLYNLNYDSRCVPENANLLKFHVKMCILADKYDIQPLKKLAEQKFKELISSKPFGEQDLEEAALSVLKFQQPTAQIREHIAEFIVQANSGTRKDVFPYEALLRQNAELATDICKALKKTGRCSLSAEGKLLQYKCPGCEGKFVAVIPEERTDFRRYYCPLCCWHPDLGRWGLYATNQE